jgi:septal ring factor EnvC (AmiA/AmiB activator)
MSRTPKGHLLATFNCEQELWKAFKAKAVPHATGVLIGWIEEFVNGDKIAAPSSSVAISSRFAEIIKRLEHLEQQIGYPTSSSASPSQEVAALEKANAQLEQQLQALEQTTADLTQTLTQSQAQLQQVRSQLAECEAHCQALLVAQAVPREAAVDLLDAATLLSTLKTRCGKKSKATLEDVRMLLALLNADAS